MRLNGYTLTLFLLIGGVLACQSGSSVGGTEEADSKIADPPQSYGDTVDPLDTITPTGCDPELNGVDCEDGDPCTLEACEKQVCATYANADPACGPTRSGVACTADSDCAHFAPDPEGCKVSICANDIHLCIVTTREDGSPCDNGSICSSNDSCADGECIPGTSANCAEPDVCSACPDLCESCSPPCGDGDCAPEESCESCPADCGSNCDPICGDTLCDALEDCESCAADCGECPNACGNQVCDVGETCEGCPEDCGVCPTSCGDGNCELSEDCATCPEDCPTDDGFCCGNGTCEEGEDCLSCTADCGECIHCGDDICDGSESCVTCATDCGECPCGPTGSIGPPMPDNGLCIVHGCAGETVDCSLQIARSDSAVEAATGLQLILQYNPSVLELENLYDEKCFSPTVCGEVPLVKIGSQTNQTGHSFSTLPTGEAPCNVLPCLWNGDVHVLIVNLSGTIALSNAFLDENGAIIGDAEFAWARFKLLEDISMTQALTVWLTNEEPDDLVAVGPSFVELPAKVVDGVIITEGFNPE